MNNQIEADGDRWQMCTPYSRGLRRSYHRSSHDQIFSNAYFARICGTLAVEQILTEDLQVVESPYYYSGCDDV